MRRFDLLCTVSCLLFAGCYSYTPLQTPTPGADIRARLTSEAAIRHSEGLYDPILHYEGRVVEAGSDSLALDILVARSSTTFQDIEIRDTIRLARMEIQSIESRELSTVRTVLFAVGVGAGVFAVVKGIDQVVGGTGDDDTDPPPPAVVMPLSRWLGTLVFGRGRQ